MKIGPVRLDNNIILAPLAGITNLPFRLLAKEAGCGLVCSEMLSSNGIVHGSKKTLQLFDSTPAEKPLSVQIFGADPFIMAEAASIVEDSGADILDINLGCSVKKIIKTGAGVALMKAPETGYQALEMAKIAEACGIDAITIHPRTATQGFGGAADWSLISSVKKAVLIPVIGNGDITYPDDALKMLATTGCDGVMIGRAAIGNPLIFSHIKAGLNNDDLPPFNIEQHFDIMRGYLNASVDYLGEVRACQMMRSRLGWFAKGLPHSSKFRESIRHISSRSEALERISFFQAAVKQHYHDRDSGITAGSTKSQLA
ncbi:MAG: tRNA-dihydrouridine synthase [Deltaproteobacteria bacterium]|nr:tRNA-dihydrouridine synthase [Deltaproteobacteria bacterium]